MPSRTHIRTRMLRVGRVHDVIRKLEESCHHSPLWILQTLQTCRNSWTQSKGGRKCVAATSMKTKKTVLTIPYQKFLMIELKKRVLVVQMRWNNLRLRRERNGFRKAENTTQGKELLMKVLGI